MMTNPKIYLRLIALGTSTLIVVFTFLWLPSWPAVSPPVVAAETAPVKTDPAAFFANLNLEAKAVMVWDVENRQVLYESNADQQLPLASITKIMTALVAADIFADSDLITISPSALAGGSNAGLLEGDTWTFKDLIDYKLTTSSNGASSAIAEAANQKTNNDFITRMNSTASTLGLDKTYFINATGLDVGELYGGSYGSARDIAILLSHIITRKPDLMTATTKSSINRTSQSGRTYTGKNTNDILNQIPGLLASKTGYTLAAGGNLAIAFDAGLRQPVVIVVLGSSLDGRFRDVLKLTGATFNYFSN